MSNKTKEIDLRLAVACSINPEGHAWSGLDVADYLDVHHSLIQQIEDSALKKLRLRVPAMAKILEEQDMTYRTCRPTSPRLCA